MSYPTYSDLELEIQNLEEENRKLKSEIENMKEVGRENIETLDRMSIELENYSKSFKRYRDFSKQELADSLYDAEEQNKKLKSDLWTVIYERDNAFKKIEQLKEDIDNWFNRETDLRNKRADSLLENKDLRDKIEELEKEIEELNKMMLFETELEK